VAALILAGCASAPPPTAQSPDRTSDVRRARSPDRATAVEVEPPPEPAPEAAGTPPPASAPAPLAVGDPGPALPTRIPDTPIRFSGGDASSVAQAVAIHGAHGETDGVAAEYWYVTALLGKRGVDWHLRSQALLEKSGHQYDRLDIVAGPKSRQFFFDISDYFGKF
jgi:hypothetical protein